MTIEKQNRRFAAKVDRATQKLETAIAALRKLTDGSDFAALVDGVEYSVAPAKAKSKYARGGYTGRIGSDSIAVGLDRGHLPGAPMQLSPTDRALLSQINDSIQVSRA